MDAIVILVIIIAEIFTQRTVEQIKSKIVAFEIDDCKWIIQKMIVKN